VPQGAQSESTKLSPAFFMALTESWLGVLLAGPVFGVACVIFSLPGNVGGLPGWFVMGGLAAFFGGVLALVSSVFAIFIIEILNWSLGFVFSPRTGVILFGGLSGFGAAAALFFGIDGSASTVFDDLWLFRLPAIGIVAAMVFGQIGGLWWPTLLGIPSPKLTANGKGLSPFQFQVRHLLVAMVWFGLIFAIDGLWESHGLLKLVAFYAVAQIVLLLAFRMFFHLCGDKVRAID
jgi:hypothetical protein